MVGSIEDRLKRTRKLILEQLTKEDLDGGSERILIDLLTQIHRISQHQRGPVCPEIQMENSDGRKT